MKKSPSQKQSAQKFNVSLEEVKAIDDWFIGSPRKLGNFKLDQYVSHNSKKLNISESETLELLQERLEAVKPVKNFLKLLKWVFIFGICIGIYYFITKF